MAEKYVPVETKKLTGRVYLDEILYVEKNLRKTILVTEEDKITLYCAMEFVKAYVDDRFLDCHRSYLFNMDKIKQMTEQTIVFENGDRIPLGRDCFRAGRKIYRDYLHKRKTGENGDR